MYLHYEIEKYRKQNEENPENRYSLIITDAYIYILL